MNRPQLYKPRAAGRGYILVSVLVLVAVAALVVSSSLDLASSSNRAVAAAASRTSEFIDTEQTFNIAATWLRTNSTGMADPFSRNNFYNNFDRTAPAVPANDTSIFTVPTKIKRQGTNDAVVLTTSSTGVTGWFPTSTDTATGSAFNALSTFTSASLGSKLVRLTLVDALPVDAAKDFGDPDTGAAQPQTDFQPVYRIDSFDSVNSGAHLYGYAVGSLQYDYGIGFYGHNYMEIRQPCDSYISNNGAYSSATKRANCSTGSNTDLRIHQNTSVYGSAKSNGTITDSSPFGGEVCSDFASNCPNAGQSCSGVSCQVPGLPTFSTWNTYCPTNQGSVTPASGSTLTVAGNSANQKCWNSVTIGNNRIVTLTSTAYPYFIDTLSVANNGRLNFAPSPATGTITLYVRNIVGNSFNGNQVYNVNNKPYQFRLNYLGTNDLTMNGTAAMHGFLVSPYAGITVQGNFDFSGGIKALNLTFTGSGTLHYDESGDITTLKDISYEVRNVTQRYR